MKTRGLLVIMLLCMAIALPQPIEAQDTAHVYLPLLASMPASVTVVTPEPIWTAGWWQWIERMNNLPLYEQGAVDCSQGQTGTEWFLAGTQGGSAVRSCTVPADKTFVVPILTVAWGNEGDESLSVPEKRQVLSDVFSDSVPGILESKLCYLESSIDGRTVANTRVQSPPFLHIGDPEGVADGYWFAFRLPAGQHTVHLAGRLCNYFSDAPIFDVDVTYTLTVQ